ncbi:MAG: hypothetical protein Q7R52_00670 [archaeon]|nr:hypothetical protein [archaeon]
MDRDIEKERHLLKLQNADILAMTIDIMVKKGVINARSAIADARLNYGEPNIYEFIDEKSLKKYRDKLI